ncbi:MAG: hypothetical protein R3D03_15660 [Geminicoccaceae bacterium]
MIEAGGIDGWRTDSHRICATVTITVFATASRGCRLDQPTPAQTGGNRSRAPIWRRSGFISSIASSEKAGWNADTRTGVDRISQP